MSDEFEPTHDELKLEAEKILFNLRQNPLKIEMEATDTPFHFSEFEDVRVSIAFTGRYAHYAALFVEFWCPRIIRPFPIQNNSFFTADLHNTQLSAIRAYQQKLQSSELAEYKDKLLASPLNCNLSDDEIDAKITNIMENGDKDQLFFNSKTISNGTTFTISNSGEGTHSEIEATINALEKKPLIIIVMDTQVNNSDYAHITTLQPEIDYSGDENDIIARISSFIEGLPQILTAFV